MKPEFHGYYYHPLYQVWRGMRKRIYNKNHVGYKNYGGRGITICKEWNESAKAFIEWALNGGWEKGLFIDRIDNDGNYCPENCRFITIQKSNKNKRLLQSNNTSGFRGVYWQKAQKKWCSHIKINSKKKHLGYFDSLRIAALRYDVEAYRLNDGRPGNFFKGEHNHG